jgi:hypothetical protein
MLFARRSKTSNMQEVVFSLHGLREFKRMQTQKLPFGVPIIIRIGVDYKRRHPLSVYGK